MLENINQIKNSMIINDKHTLVEDFQIQLARSQKCLEINDVLGSERWNQEASKTLEKLSRYHSNL